MAALGPAAERLGQLSQDEDLEAELFYNRTREAVTGADFAAKEESYLRQLMRSKAEITHLREVVQRQDIELNAYQSQLPNSVAPSPEEIEAKLAEGVAPWVAQPALMSPLLVAYDARIQEAEAANKRLLDQVKKIDERARDLATENERLLGDLQQYADAAATNVGQSTPAGLGSVGTGGVAGPGSGVGHALLQEHISELMDMNDTLMKANALLQQQQADARDDCAKLSEELDKRDDDLAALRLQHEHAATAAMQHKRRISQVAEERDATLAHLRESIAQAESARRAEQEALELSKEKEKSARAAATQVREYKSAMDELKKALVAEQEDVDARTKGALSRARDLRSKLNETESELDALKAAHRQLRREYETTRGDCEGMLKVMDGMEKQVSEYATREEQTLALARESRESVEQANLERDQGIAREAQARREIARLLEEKRTGAAEAEARQEVAVKAVRESMEQRLLARDAEVNALAAELSALKHDLETANRARRAAEEQLTALTSGVAEEQARLAAVAADLTQKVSDAAASREAAAQGEKGALARLEDADRAWAIERAELAYRLRTSIDERETATRELEQSREEAKRLASAGRAAAADAAACRKDFARMRERFQQDADRLDERCKAAVSEANERLEAAMVGAARAKQRAAALLQQQTRLTERSQKELQASLAHFERLLREQKEEARRLAGRNAELEALVPALVEARDDAVWAAANAAAQSAPETTAALRVALNDAEQRAAASAMQVGELLGREEFQARKVREAEMERERKEKGEGQDRVQASAE